MTWRTMVAVAILILLILAIAFVLGLVGALGVTGVGWIVTRVFPALSLFQASLIALILDTGILFVAYRLLTVSLDQTFYERGEEEEEEEEVEPPIVPWRRSQPADEACPAPGKAERQKSRRGRK